NSGVEVGEFTYVNTRLTSPSLSRITLRVTIAGASGQGQRTVGVPLQVIVTPNDVNGNGPDTIRLIGKPIIRLQRGFAVQIVGFGLATTPGQRPFLTNHLTLNEDTSATVPLIGKLIRV